MKVKIKSVIAAALAVLTLLSSMPVMAASVGSSSADKSAGEDTAQGVVTEYGETSGNSIGTDAYLTVDSSDLIASVPTTIILSGVADENGAYTGDYSVTAQGDMSGTEFLYIEPASESVDLIQSGKDNVSATITQEQTVFNSAEVSASASSTGVVSASSLTAGSWNADSSFLIGVIDNSVAKVEYFTWGEDADFMSAYESSDLSDYPGLTVAKENENSTYSYPDATAITGITDEGIEWIKQNEGKLILPTFATSIADSTNNGLDSAFGRFNSEYGSELSNVVTYVYVPENISYIGSWAFCGLENLGYADINSNSIGSLAFFNCDALTCVDFNNKVNILTSSSIFNMCINLQSVVGASNVESVGRLTFGYCYKLEKIDSLSNCQTVEDKAFLSTYSLELIGLTDNIKFIGSSAFEGSSCKDQFVEFSNCEYGEYAVADMFYPENGIPEYTYAPCVNEISHFAQHDQRWSQLNIGNTSKKYGSSGCGWCCLAAVYNYYNGTDVTPVGVVDVLMENNPSAIGSGSFSCRDDVYTAVGLTSEQYGAKWTFDESNINSIDTYQPLYDALADGKVAIINYNVHDSSNGGHSIVAYGVTEEGKLMCADGSLAIHNNAVDPDYTTTDDMRLQEPYYFTVEPWAILHSWDNYTIVSK